MSEIYVANDKELVWEWFFIWFTYNVDQHGALFNGTNTSRDGNNHQTYGNDNHESCRCEEVIVHKNAEVIENSRNGGSNSHKEKGSELWSNP